jgi:hypothetical protein
VGKINKYDFENSVAEYLQNNPLPCLFGIGITRKDRAGEPAEFLWLLREEGEENIPTTAIVLSVMELEKEIRPNMKGSILTSLTKNDASEILTYAYLFGEESKNSELFNTLREIERLEYNEEAILLCVVNKDFFGQKKSFEGIATDLFYSQLFRLLAKF